MPKGPKGQKRPADVIGNAVRVMEIATGQREEECEPEATKNQAAAELGRKGGEARAKAVSADKRADGEYAMAFMDDLRSRLANRVQLTSDGHRAYLEAVESAFGSDVDYAQLVKLYGAAPESMKGRYSPAEGLVPEGVLVSRWCVGAQDRSQKPSHQDGFSHRIQRGSPRIS